ncbi:MAG: hypothetical protein QXL94_07360 [Candidatus Parvarchaeum sp.]
MNNDCIRESITIYKEVTAEIKKVKKSCILILKTTNIDLTSIAILLVNYLYLTEAAFHKLISMLRSIKLVQQLHCDVNDYLQDLPSTLALIPKGVRPFNR